MDSPSRQLLTEQIERLRLNDREFVEQLDKEEQQAREQHNSALEAAKANHERIRQRAELETQQWLLQQEQEKRKEIEEAEAKLKAEREKEIAELARQERQREAEASRLAQVQERERLEKAAKEAEREKELKARIAALEAREKARQQAEEEIKRKEQEEVEKAAAAAAAELVRKAKETAAATAAAAAASKQIQPTAPTTTAASTASVSKAALSLISAAKNESLHQEYLALYQYLKSFRKEIKELTSQDRALKNEIFEGRMEIKKRVGQIRGVKGGHKEPTQHITQAFSKALSKTNHVFDARKLVVKSSPLAQQPGPVQVPLVFIYMIHIFGKCMIQQFVREGASNAQIVDNIGIAAISVFSQPFMQCGGIALVDMFVSKIHSFCPILFGIYADGRTAEGRDRLGWRWRNKDKISPVDNEKFTRAGDDRQTHISIIAGVSAGFGSLYLRDLSRLQNRRNPFPNSEYWLAMSRIVNTPTAEVTEFHLIVLKALIEHNAAKFIKLYGQLAKVAIRHALTVFPLAFDKKYPISAGSLKVLAEFMEKEMHVTL